ncbi:glycosyltransferase family 4 protein [Rhodoferax mekongensis]|uniref:Glycosyltransferase family 1 protein n=1 Tax=Rhodoferax mekongensis TaxID=3068341 RepID=A0ABZ0B2A2_9BURK|nr:glycosyltransferase family 1 protein [Rhodoferax sp. TBRC 17307]WNO05830.1 glycosyltransferase family 1 protein [Rhodoferax sp. TBRC 17307]
MRILINALSARLGGGQTYLRNLLLHVPPGEWRIFLLCPDNFDLQGMPENVERIAVGRDLSNPYRRALWEILHLGRMAQRLNAQVLFSPGGLLPRLGLPVGLKTVVTFQNMLPYDRTQRQRYPWGARRLREWLLERGLSAAMRRANLVIFISRFAADFIQSRIGPLGGRAVVIPHGIHPRFLLNSARPLPRPEIAPDGEYYLYVSFVDFYKSQIEVLQSFASMKVQGLAPGTLVIAGGGYAPYQSALRAEIARLGLEASVLLSGNLPHEQLPALYQHAHLNLFASRTENCPNILMEIMAAGRPALVSNSGPMPEFAGDTVFYFDPTNPHSIADAWRQALDNAQEAEQKAMAAIDSVKCRTWQRASESVWREIALTVSKG